MLVETLESLLPISALISVFVDGSFSRLLAQELHAELWEGRTDLLGRELCALKKNVLKEPHGFGRVYKE